MKKIHLPFFSIISFFGIAFSQNNALNYDGNNDDISLVYSPALAFDINDKFTIEAWFKTNSSTFIIWSNHVDIAPFPGYEVAVVFGKVMMEFDNNYISNALRIETTNTFNDGNWHHAAWVYQGVPNPSACQIYVDGVLQTLNVNVNNLSSSFSTTNEVHIGSRDATTYFAPGSLDEIRIWKRDLCAAEIQARKNCHLIGNEFDLEAYYNFNQGIAASNNSTVTTLIDHTTNNHNGTLSNFSLTGSSSNWIASTASITGTCSAFGNLVFTGQTTLCAGSSATLGVSGGSTYTWVPGNLTTPNINVSPTISIIYTVNATSSVNCISSGIYSVTVNDCTGIKESTQTLNNLITIYPNPVKDELFISGNVNDKIIEVYSILGKIILKENVNANSSIDVKKLDQGIYFLHIISSDSKNILKFIKE